MEGALNLLIVKASGFMITSNVKDDIHLARSNVSVNRLYAANVCREYGHCM